MNKDITQKILSIIANFNLSEVEQLNELEILYMKQEQEIERLNNIIKEVKDYIEKMSYCSIVDNPKKDLQKILKKEKNV